MSNKNKMRGNPVLTKRKLRINLAQEIIPIPDEIPVRGKAVGKTPAKPKNKDQKKGK